MSDMPTIRIIDAAKLDQRL